MPGLVELDVLAEQGLSRAVDRRERSAQLMRDGRDELALELVERAFLGQAAERVDDPVAERDARDREPELAPVEFEGDDRRLDASRPGRGGNRNQW